MIQAQSTKATKAGDLKREWHVIDLKGQTLGRAGTKIAGLLMGKSKPYFVRNLDCGDYVVVLNAKDIKVTGKKEVQKTYNRHSGYPGGFTSETLKELRVRKPEEIIMHAVKGMLPDNRLKSKMMARFYVNVDETNRYEHKMKGESTNSDK